MQWIDTHTHLFADLFKEDISQVITECKIFGINKLLLPNIDRDSVLGMEALMNQYPGVCYGMMGLHPTSVDKDYRKQLRELHDKLKANPDRYIAVGEIGTDLYWDKTYEHEMEIAFREQIRWAVEYDKPIVIHSRDSLDWNIGIVKEMKEANPSLTGVFHCFNGTPEQAKQIAALGFYMGVGGVITFKNAGVAETMADIPLEFLVMETDSPYLAPSPHRGKRNSSVYIPLIAEKLAEVKDLPLKEIAQITTENAKALFRL